MRGERLLLLRRARQGPPGAFRPLECTERGCGPRGGAGARPPAALAHRRERRPHSARRANPLHSRRRCSARCGQGRGERQRGERSEPTQRWMTSGRARPPLRRPPSRRPPPRPIRDGRCAPHGDEPPAPAAALPAAAPLTVAPPAAAPDRVSRCMDECAGNWVLVVVLFIREGRV